MTRVSFIGGLRLIRRITCATRLTAIVYLKRSAGLFRRPAAANRVEQLRERAECAESGCDVTRRRLQEIILRREKKAADKNDSCEKGAMRSSPSGEARFPQPLPLQFRSGRGKQEQTEALVHDTELR